LIGYLKFGCDGKLFFTFDGTRLTLINSVHP
jgi:hypothetical protein